MMSRRIVYATLAFAAVLGWGAAVGADDPPKGNQGYTTTRMAR
jgi:hypothetical protein